VVELMVMVIGAIMMLLMVQEKTLHWSRGNTALRVFL
jgi:hypothetical protein